MGRSNGYGLTSWLVCVRHLELLFEIVVFEGECDESVEDEDEEIG